MNSQDYPSESHRDGYEGISWAERSTYGVLGAVLDPADTAGRKNIFLDQVHRLALREALGRSHFTRALDFGTGTGRFLRLLAHHSGEVYALDRTSEMLAIARTQYSMPEDHFVCSRALEFPFSDRLFDLVLSVYVLSVAPRADFQHLIGELS